MRLGDTEKKELQADAISLVATEITVREYFSESRAN